MAARSPRSATSRQRLDLSVLLRAVRYAGRHRRVAVLAYGCLLIATAAQLIVPQLVRVIIDSVTGGLQVQAVSGGNSAAAVQALVGAMIAIVVFSLVRAVFAY